MGDFNPFKFHSSIKEIKRNRDRERKHGPLKINPGAKGKPDIQSCTISATCGAFFENQIITRTPTSFDFTNLASQSQQSSSSSTSGNEPSNATSSKAIAKPTAVRNSQGPKKQSISFPATEDSTIYIDVVSISRQPQKEEFTKALKKAKCGKIDDASKQALAKIIADPDYIQQAYDGFTEALQEQQKKLKEIVLGLPVSIWDYIFQHLTPEDLQRFRLVSYNANSLVEKSFQWSVNFCFVFDAERHSMNKQTSTGAGSNNLLQCPKEVICEDNTLGWPYFRLRNAITPFSTKDFFPNNNVRDSILILELFNCILSWKDVLELFGHLPKLETFSYIFTEEFLQKNDVYSPLRQDLNENYDVVGKLKQLSTKKRYRRAKINATRHLKTINLETLNLEITNILLAVLENICISGLEKLVIEFSESYFLTLAQNPGIVIYNQRKKLKARKLLNNNQKSLKTLSLSIHQPRQALVDSEGNVEMPSSVFFKHLFFPTYENLQLEELSFVVPPTIVIQCRNYANARSLMAQVPIPNVDDAVQKYVFSFTRTQPILRFFTLSNVYSLCIPNFIFLKRHFYSGCKIRIAAQLTFRTKENGNWIDWTENPESVDMLNEMFIIIHEGSVPFDRTFHDAMPILKRMEKFKLFNATKNIESFKLNQLVTVFPNLKSLILADLENKAKINDLDIQTIIYFLPTLTELVLKCDMSELSDYGMTGVSSKASKRMLQENRFKRLKGDVIGHPLCSLKRLQILEMHGIGEKVTNVSAYLGFRDLPCLEELYLYSPKFSKMARKFLKEKFNHRKGFSIGV